MHLTLGNLMEAGFNYRKNRITLAARKKSETSPDNSGRVTSYYRKK